MSDRELVYNYMSGNQPINYLLDKAGFEQTRTFGDLETIQENFTVTASDKDQFAIRTLGDIETIRKNFNKELPHSADSENIKPLMDKTVTLYTTININRDLPIKNPLTPETQNINILKMAKGKASESSL